MSSDSSSTSRTHQLSEAVQDKVKKIQGSQRQRIDRNEGDYNITKLSSYTSHTTYNPDKHCFTWSLYIHEENLETDRGLWTQATFSRQYWQLDCSTPTPQPTRCLPDQTWRLDRRHNQDQLSSWPDIVEEIMRLETQDRPRQAPLQPSSPRSSSIQLHL